MRIIRMVVAGICCLAAGLLIPGWVFGVLGLYGAAWILWPENMA